MCCNAITMYGTSVLLNIENTIKIYNNIKHRRNVNNNFCSLPLQSYQSLDQEQTESASVILRK